MKRLRCRSRAMAEGLGLADRSRRATRFSGHSRFQRHCLLRLHPISPAHGNPAIFRAFQLQKHLCIFQHPRCRPQDRQPIDEAQRRFSLRLGLRCEMGSLAIAADSSLPASKSVPWPFLGSGERAPSSPAPMNPASSAGRITASWWIATRFVATARCAVRRR